MQITAHFITQFKVLALLEDGAFPQAPHLIRESYVWYALIGWPSPRRKEESHRHVQRVCATLGAKPAKPKYAFNGVFIRRQSSFDNRYIILATIFSER